jgi:hypothetical protein
MLQLTAPAGIPSGRDDCIGREAYGAPRPHEIHTSTLKRFAQRLERITTEFADLIKKQETSMRPRQLAWGHTRAATDQASHGDVVMWCT